MFSSTETIINATSRLLGGAGGAGGDGEDTVPRVVGQGPTPNWNTAPTHTVPVLREFGEQADGAQSALTLGPASWGYPAPWKKGLVLFNARGESVFDKPSFRGSEPCLFVMDGWYEWHRKRPYFVSGGGLMFVAGLCRPQKEGDGLDATIVTTASAGPVEWLHDRMPRVLGIAGEGSANSADTADSAGTAETRAWIDADPDAMRSLAGSQPGVGILDRLTTDEVDRRVGNVANNGPDLLTPVPTLGEESGENPGTGTQD